jgi:trimeric autotransporter adhesin
MRPLSAILLTSVLFWSAFGQTYTISTLAGGGLPVGIPGKSAGLHRGEPQVVAADRAGNLFFVYENAVLRLDGTTSILTLVAGNGTPGYSGDNGPATRAQLASPGGVAVDSAGNLYVADTANSRIRKISNGVITTVAGNGTQGFSGDNGSATSAQLFAPVGVAVDFASNLYIADSRNFRIRKVSRGVITTVGGMILYLPGIHSSQGCGTWTFSGDNGPPDAQLDQPSGVAVDSASNLYIADYEHYCVRKVSNGVITTVAGNGTWGFRGDNGPATSAQLSGRFSYAVDSAGNLYIADGNSRIRKVSKGVITTVAGNGRQGFSGDNGPATSAQLSGPSSVAVDSAGNLYFADAGNLRIRKVSRGVITTVAGNGSTWLPILPNKRT